MGVNEKDGMVINRMNKLDAKCRRIREEDLEMIMNWRMMPEITKYMVTDPKLTLDGQKLWYERIKNNPDEFHWVLEVDGIPSGIASLVSMNKTAKWIHTGVYIAEKKKRSLKLTMELQWNLYEYAFEVLGMEKVCEEVFAENKEVLRILDMCGSKGEGVLRRHVFKNGVYYDMAVRGILHSEWEDLKEKINYTHFEFE